MEAKYLNKPLGNEDLENAVITLCKDIDKEYKKQWKHYNEKASYHTAEVGRSYIKIVSVEDPNSNSYPKRSVWGFINLKNKKFKEGDVLKGRRMVCTSIECTKRKYFRTKICCSRNENLWRDYLK